MDISYRLFQLRLLEKMEAMEHYARILGLEDRSRFHGRVITEFYWSETPRKKIILLPEEER